MWRLRVIFTLTDDKFMWHLDVIFTLTNDKLSDVYVSSSMRQLGDRLMLFDIENTWRVFLII